MIRILKIAPDYALLEVIDIILTFHLVILIEVKELRNLVIEDTVVERR